MDVKNLTELLNHERKFFSSVLNRDDWIEKLFCEYLSPTNSIQKNNFLNEPNQTVGQWKKSFSLKKFTSWKRYKRFSKHKIYIQPLGPFPMYFYYNGAFGNELKNCLKTFVELFFPGFIVDFLPVVNYSDLNIKTRYHEKSKQLQLFLPDVNSYLKANVPEDAFCLCCFSWFDYFPSYILNHILGEGLIENGTVAFTFGHYAMFKEKDIIQAELWKADIVMAKPFDISDSLRRDTNSSNKDCYDYITEGEKEEAIVFTQDYDQEGCSGNHYTNDDCHSDKKYSAYNPRVLFIPRHRSAENTAELRRKLNQPDQEELERKVGNVHHDNDDEDDQEESVVITMNGNTPLDLTTALPPNCKFYLNCKILRRLLRVISHEICHVMGLAHCQYYSCTMNMSVSVLHADTQPLFLCPICLRKIHLLQRFSLMERYKKIQSFLLLHTDVCNRRGLHPEELKTMQKTQVLKGDGICLFKNDLVTVMGIVEYLEKL